MAEMMMPQMGGQDMQQPEQPDMQQQDIGGQQPQDVEQPQQGMQEGDSFDAEAAAPYMEQGAGEISEGGMPEGGQQEENHTMEEAMQAVINYLYQTTKSEGLDLDVQVKAVETLTKSLANLVNCQQPQQDAGMQQDSHMIDMHHKTRMNDLEYEGEQSRLKREEEKHMLDALYQQQIHEHNLQSQQQKNEMEMVNNQQKSRQNEEQHQANLERQKRDSKEAPSKAGQS